MRGFGIARADQRGATLTELMIVLAIFGMIVAGIMAVWQKTQESYFVGSEAADLQGNLRVALDQIAHEIRRAARDLTDCAFDIDQFSNCNTAKVSACKTKLGLPQSSSWTCAGIFFIPTATSTTIQIRQDLNDDALVTGTNEDVTFAFSAANSRITRNGQALAEQIVALQFTYWRYTLVNGLCTGSSLELFDPSGSQTARDCIRRVSITVTAQTTTGGETLTRTARTDVDLRTR